MRKLLLILGFTSIVLGAAIVYYDAYFIHRYGVDANDAVGVYEQTPIPWPTGEQPAFAEYPAWHYGAAFVIVAIVLFISCVRFRWAA